MRTYHLVLGGCAFLLGLALLRLVLPPALLGLSLLRLVLLPTLLSLSLPCCPAYSKPQVLIVLVTTPSAAAIASCMTSSKSCPFLRRSGSGPTLTPQAAIALRKAVRTSVLIFSLAIPMRIAC